MSANARATLLFLGLAALLASLWLAGRDDRATLGVDEESRTDAAKALEAPAKGEAAAAPKQQTQEDRVAVGRPTEPEPPPLVVRVTREGKPVADADVLYATFVDPHELTAEQKAELSRRRNDAEAVLRYIGRQARTNAEGEVRVPCPKVLSRSLVWFREMRGPLHLEPQGFVVARKSHLFGYAVVRKPGSLLEVRLELDREFVIRVLDAAGNPAAGVEIAWESRRERSSPATFVALGRTFADGTLRVAHSQARLARKRNDVSRALVHEPGIELPPADVSFARPGRREIVFRLPPTGSIDVRIVGSDRAPVSGRGAAWLADPGHMLDGFALTRHTWNVVSDDGEFLFPYVGLGKSFEVSGRFRRNLATERMIGPIRAGQIVEHELHADTQPTITGRFVDVAGKPVREELVSLKLEIAGRKRAETFRTDSKGRFLVAYKPSLAGKTVDSIDANVFGRGPPTGLSRLTTFVMNPGVDLGDLIVSPAPMIARGNVVDENGELVQDAFISVYQAANRFSCTAQTNGGGRFKVYSRATKGPFRLRVKHSDYVPYEQDFDVGASLRIVLERAGSLQGRVRHPPGLLRGSLRVDLTGPESAGSKVRAASVREERDGSLYFRWTNLPVGRYRAALWLLGDSKPLLSVDRIKIVAGENTDPRLDLDIREAVHVITIQLLQRDGTPFDDARDVNLFVQRTDDPRLFDGRSCYSSTPVLLTRTLPRNVVLAANGYRVVRLNGLAKDVEVRLEPVPRVQVELDFPNDRALAAATVRVQFQPTRATAERFRLDGREPQSTPLSRPFVSFTSSSNRRQHLFLPGPEVYQVSLRVSAGTRTAAVGDFTPTTFRVDPTSPGQRLVVRVTPEALRAALK